VLSRRDEIGGKGSSGKAANGFRATKASHGRGIWYVVTKSRKASKKKKKDAGEEGGSSTQDKNRMRLEKPDLYENTLDESLKAIASQNCTASWEKKSKLEASKPRRQAINNKHSCPPDCHWGWLVGERGRRHVSKKGVLCLVGIGWGVLWRGRKAPRGKKSHRVGEGGERSP